MWFWLFIVSLLIVLVLMLYVRWLLQIIATANQDMESLSEMITDFSSHINSIHELEMFYGDTTLHNLLEHSRELVAILGGLDLVLNESKETKEIGLGKD